MERRARLAAFISRARLLAGGGKLVGARGKPALAPDVPWPLRGEKRAAETKGEKGR